MVIRPLPSVRANSVYCRAKEVLPGRFEILWRTLVADSYIGQRPAPSQCGQKFLENVSVLVYRAAQATAPTKVPGKLPIIRKILSRNHSRKLKKDPMAAPWLRLIDHEADDSPYSSEVFTRVFLEINNKTESSYNEWSHAHAQFRLEFNLAAGRRRLIRTREGLLGLGPTHTCQGDELWVLAGARTPVVLHRLENGHHQFVGQAYVHGTMHGKVTDGVFDLQEITLE